MMALDREARAERYLHSMAALENLLAGHVPSLPIDVEPLAQLVSLLNDEARKVVPRHSPGERAPGLRCANDEMPDD